jgi:hypothetical protein
MFPYWVLFAAGALFALPPQSRSSAWVKPVAVALAVALSIFIGLRYEVGVDWLTYRLIFVEANSFPLADAFLYGDPAYSVLNWLVGEFGGDIWHVNLVCAIIFSYGLLRLCLSLPQPGLAFLAAIPTLIVVTSMGYTRQATALGCVMVAATQFRGTINMKWPPWLLLGVLFHKSVILVLPIFALSGSRNRTLNLALIGGMGLFLLLNVLLRGLEQTLALYAEAELQSSGTLPRISIGAVLASVFFILPNRREQLGELYIFWRNMALASLFLVPAYYVIPSTTIVDRVGVLLLPLQLVTWSLIPAAIRRAPLAIGVVKLAAIVFNGAVLGVWLLYAQYSLYWMPYRNVILELFP